MQVDATGVGLLARTENESWNTAAVMRPTAAAFSPGSILNTKGTRCTAVRMPEADLSAGLAA